MNENYEIINIDDTKYQTLYTSKYRNRKKYELPNPKVVNSLIPGTIKDIHFKEGDSVQEGISVLVLEAMKMKNAILAPVSGKIKRINVKVNDKVPKNHLLFEME